MVVYHESEEIMTNKFNVGDKVRILNEVDSQFKIGTIGVIKGCDHSGYREWEVSVNGDSEWFDPDEIELVGPQFTNNQRITALEKEVVHLSKIVNIQGELIGDLIGKLKSFEFVLAEQSKLTSVRSSTERSTALSVTTVEDIPFFVPAPVKTANQLRAEIIEKAKGFIEESKVELTLNRGRGYVIHPGWICDLKFEVNEEKRTVVAILSWKPNHYKKSDVKARGIAKCDPSDVFNEHIGKAIALGRALGLDVGEFEQAVQPTEKVVGMDVVYNADGRDYNVRLMKKNTRCLYSKGTAAIGSYVSNCSKVVNDTHAQYEVNK